MDVEAANKKLAQLSKALHACLITLDEALGHLPAPLNLPIGSGDLSLVLDALDLAWDLAGQENLSAVTLARVREIITAWTSARETVMVATLWGPAPWRLRAVEDAVERIEAGAAAVTRQLRGDFRFEQLTPAERAEIAAWVARSPGVRRKAPRF